MHKFTNTLTPAQVDRYAVDFCQPHLQFRTVGKVTGEVILSVLFAAAARISSIHETCGRLAKAPCEVAVYFPTACRTSVVMFRWEG